MVQYVFTPLLALYTICRYIPLLVPWTDVWLNNPRPGTYPPELLATLKKVLRPNVPYITVSQVKDQSTCIRTKIRSLRFSVLTQLPSFPVFTLFD